MSCMRAVSYTHLDVYKRQGQRAAIARQQCVAKEGSGWISNIQRAGQGADVQIDGLRRSKIRSEVDDVLCSIGRHTARPVASGVPS